ncbi:fimbrial assembly protein [Cellulomonas fengjieae]|uniref:Fimbrial assembly protein n=1 Tax=Cellulomonas fengjieae TaxID=2819978 RepID=A0ABS3SKP0_9CELL|nr:fimbrial assembly protein [Cellulomonas fengjieae]MBO3085550.1 fimbrial assembly protein [Cellulomonas fengjieae]MBO3102658.1 fimbrial assembly protein [Cellulomonas fengjieae]QVI64413.1 fimbrial assembly protein [Cellulomonas fengjieae]
MTTLLERSKPQKRAGGALLVGLPQVNLLPPEVKAARTLRHVKQWLVVVLLLVLAMAGVMYAFALLSRTSADSALADAQGEAAQLKSQEAKYAEVQPVLDGLRRTTETRTVGMAPEVLWKPYLDAISAVLPQDVSITTFSVVQGGLVAPPPTSPDALTAQGVATVQFAARAKTLPDSAAWTEALNTIPGFYGASTSSDTLGEIDGVVAYEVTSMVQVDMAALARRFPAADTATEGS